MTQARHVDAAGSQPCSRCPWRISNQGKRHPGGWYTKANLRRLWAGLRRGERMTCHPTDPDNPVEADWLDRGIKPAPNGAKTRECAGALILQQREFMRLQGMLKEHPEDGLKRYRKLYTRGLMRDGIADVVGRYMYGGSILDPLRMARPNLVNDDVGHPDLPPFTAEEAARL